MSDYTVQIDLSKLGDISKLIESAVDSAVNDLAIEAGKQWAAAIYGTNLSDGTKHDYAKLLRIDRTGWGRYVVSADYKKADQIEEGTPGRDLKRMLQTSNKTRQGKNGKYLIIPMRANTPGNTAHAMAMPTDIHAIVTREMPGTNDFAFQRSKVIGSGTRLSATGASVNQSQYEWGNRLPAGLAPKLAPHHKTDPFAGMVAMDTSTGKKRSSAYLTFRVMSERSNGWLVRAKPGLHIVRNVAAEVERMAPGFMQNRINQLLGS